MQSSYTTQLNKYWISYTDSKEYNILKNEIFVKENYFFETESTQPFIIDVGAHIGLATLYFKKLYPHAQVFAFEPNPFIIDIFNSNISQNRLKDVTLFEIALCDKKGKRDLFIDNSDKPWYSTGSLLKADGFKSYNNVKQIEVATDRLDNYLKKRVDLLKIDVEGAEMAILESNVNYEFIDRIFLEYHDFKTDKCTFKKKKKANARKSCDEIIRFLENRNYRVDVASVEKQKDGADLYLIKAYKKRGLTMAEAPSF